MADSEELRRLVLHAADRLKEQNDAYLERDTGWRSVIAAMALGEATLRMVAACMAVEDTKEPN